MNFIKRVGQKSPFSLIRQKNPTTQAKDPDNKTPLQMTWYVFKIIFRPRNWKLFIILVPLVILSIEYLRQDHIKMTELRDQVIAADESENDALLEESINELREFVFNNIVINIVDDNGDKKVTFGTGPFYLQHLYLRAATDALTEASHSFGADDNPNGNIYKEASLACKGKAIANGWAWDTPDYINCVLSGIEKYPSAEEIQDQIVAAIPSTQLYRKNYASPIWAPTRTGYVILAALIIIVVIFIRILIWAACHLALLFF